MDDAATRVISSALTMFDIMERRVTLVENLSKGRQPFPEMEVVYFVTPTVEAANLIVQDFSNPTKPRYGPVHMIFTDAVSALPFFASDCVYIVFSPLLLLYIILFSGSFNFTHSLL
jgi:hypothetical protein